MLFYHQVLFYHLVFILFSMVTGRMSPLVHLAETDFSYRLTPYKIVRNFFGRSYLRLPLTNQVENSLLVSVTFHLQAGMLCSFSAQLWTFFGPWGRDRSQSLPCWEAFIFFDKTNTAIHCLGVDDTAMSPPDISRKHICSDAPGIPLIRTNGSDGETW